MIWPRSCTVILLLLSTSRVEVLLWPTNKESEGDWGSCTELLWLTRLHRWIMWEDKGNRFLENRKRGLDLFRTDRDSCFLSSNVGRNRCTSWEPLSGRTAACTRHFHIISIFHREYDLSSHTAIRGMRGREETLISQGIGGHMVGWLKPAFTCWLRSTSWIKMLWCQQEGGTASRVADRDR